MPIELPEALAPLAAEVGISMPPQNLDDIFWAAQHWDDVHKGAKTVIGRANHHGSPICKALSENRGPAIDALGSFWKAYPLKHIEMMLDGAELMKNSLNTVWAAMGTYLTSYVRQLSALHDSIVSLYMIADHDDGQIDVLQEKKKLIEQTRESMAREQKIFHDKVNAAARTMLSAKKKFRDINIDLDKELPRLESALARAEARLYN